MRFRSRGKSSGEALARSQRRLKYMVVGIGLIVLIVFATGKSSYFTDLFSSPPATVPQAPDLSRGLLGAETLRSDEFRVFPSGSNDVASKYSSMLDREGIAEMETTELDLSSDAPTIPSILTRTIRDDVMGVLSTEMAAWFGTLRIAQKLTSEDLQTLPEAQFALFMDSPESCRGRAYTLRGRLRKLTPFAINQSSQSFGLRTAWDAWISTRDSGNQLVHVVAVTADSRLPNPEALGQKAPDVELTGYFFKREGYAAKGKTGEGELGLTVLFLSGKISVMPPQLVVSRASEMTPWLTWIGIAVCCSVTVLVWQFQISDSRFRGSRTHQLTVLPVRASFDGVEMRTIQQALQEMQDHARSSSPDTGLLS